MNLDRAAVSPNQGMVSRPAFQAFVRGKFIRLNHNGAMMGDWQDCFTFGSGQENPRRIYRELMHEP